MTFKIDTGAEVTAINQHTLKRLPRTTLKPATQTLLGPSQQLLNVIGQFEASIAKAGDKKSTTQDSLRSQGSQSESPWTSAIMSLHLLSQVNSTTTEHPTAEHMTKVSISLSRFR